MLNNSPTSTTSPAIAARLRYGELRSDTRLQLNRGEHRQALARWLFFANQGEFQEGDYEEIMNKVSCLSLISNAVLLWNTIQIHVVSNGNYDLSVQ